MMRDYLQVILDLDCWHGSCIQGRIWVGDCEKSGSGDGEVGVGFGKFCSVLEVEFGDEELGWFADDGLDMLATGRASRR